MKVKLRVLMRGMWFWLGSLPTLSTAYATPPAAPAGDTFSLSVIEATERGEDPLGLDLSTGKALDEAAEQVVSAPPPLPNATLGGTLSSLSQVRETSHELAIEVAHGLARVRVRLAWVSAAKHRAEVSYRLAVPKGAIVSHVSACRDASTCLKAQPLRASGDEPYARFRAALPQATPAGSALYAELLHEARNDALALRMLSLAPSERAVIEVEYVLEAQVRGGHVFLEMPARGEDPRIAQDATVRIRADDFVQDFASEFTQDAARSFTLKLTQKTDKPLYESVVRARCGNTLCTRQHRVARSAALPTRPTWIWIDASPSMEGPARSRADSVLAALLSILPGETPISAHAFAARAALLGHFRADAVALSQLSDATQLDLDAATQLAPLVSATETKIAREKPRVLILSDGAFDSTEVERRALRRASEQGAELWLLALGDRVPVSLGPMLHTLSLATAAQRALSRGDLHELSAQLNMALSREAQTGLRHGEESVRETRPRAPYPLAADSPWLAFWLARDEATPVWFASLGSHAGASIAAPPYLAADAPESLAPVTGMPAESVLEMLRNQLVPKARACLRSDRKGRADYAVNLSFRAFFQQREVSEMGIDGPVPEPLRKCLLDLLPKLRVPAFSGGVRVRYPIHTDRAPVPPIIELTPEMRESVQRVLTAPLGAQRSPK